MDLVPALSVAFAALSNVSYSLIVGALLASRWLDPKDGISLRPISLASAAVLTFCHLIHPWFVAASMSGSNQLGQVLAVTPTVLSSTRQGAIWYVNTVIVATLWGGLLVRGRLPAALFAVCLLAATKAMSVHAADSGDFSLIEISEFLHLLATSIWAGAVIVSGIAVAPRVVRFKDAAALWSYGNRLSATVTLALAVLIVSGLYISYRELNGHLTGFWSPTWGKILTAKVALVLLALALGARNRSILKRSSTAARTALLIRLLRMEACVMLLILSLSALLASTSPSG